MSRRSKACSFSSKVRARIIARDGDACVFCASGRWPLSEDDFGQCIRDIAHVVNRSQGGLGVEQNGVTACRSHHQLLDNGNKGLREELLEYAKSYLSRIYTEWDEDALTYRKGE
ncbi:MAG: hypothetical protein K2N01_13230 [Lachnospiraceae bacterium]|nr:hypothetical protein [Lachnospiraceae bacterium]